MSAHPPLPSWERVGVRGQRRALLPSPPHAPGRAFSRARRRREGLWGNGEIPPQREMLRQGREEQDAKRPLRRGGRAPPQASPPRLLRSGPDRGAPSRDAHGRLWQTSFVIPRHPGYPSPPLSPCVIFDAFQTQGPTDDPSPPIEAPTGRGASALLPCGVRILDVRKYASGAGRLPLLAPGPSASGRRPALRGDFPSTRPSTPFGRWELRLRVVDSRLLIKLDHDREH